MGQGARGKAGTLVKTFRYKLGHEAGQTMTVAELCAKLAEYPDDMPVMAGWEGVRAYVRPENFGVERVSKGKPADECDCLVIDVNDY
jgi:hypothetical protein